MRFMLLTCAILSVAGCMQGAGGPDASEPARSDGVARKLAVGVSPAEATVALGTDSGFERNPDNWDESCVSYSYGTAEAPRYVHAVFVKDALVRATDAHVGICSYDTAAS